MAKILIVDDRTINREFLSTLLDLAGHQVVEAADGLEALDAAHQHPPDLIITDILMPRMDGIELAQHLLREPALAAIPVIFHTATYRNCDAQALANQCGVAMVLAKPCEPQVILSAVSHCLSPGQAGAKAAAAELAAHRSPAAAASTLQSRAPRVDVNRSVELVQRLSLRLSALVELGLELGQIRDSQQLIDLGCRAMQDLVTARYAAIVIVDDAASRRRQTTLGFPPDTQFAALDAAGPLGEAMLAGRLWSWRRGAGTPLPPPLEAITPPIEDLLAAPLRTAMRVYGWLCLANTADEPEFDEEDEEIIATLAAELALNIENLQLSSEAAAHVARLEVEIAERRYAEAELRESEGRFRQLVDNLREVFFLMDPSHTEVLYVSPAYEEIWGRSLHSLYDTPRTWFNSVHPDDQPLVLAASLGIRETGRFDHQYRILRPDGSQRWIWARGFPILDRDGQLYRVAGIAEDITERRQQQDKIARLTRLRAVQSGISTAIVRQHERQALFDEACRVAVEHGRFGMVWISIGHPAEGLLKPVASAAMGTAHPPEAAMTWRYSEAAARGVINQALHGRKVVYCNDIRGSNGDPADVPLRAEALRQGYGAMTVLPLAPDDRSIGYMALYAREAGFFDDEELRLLSDLANDLSFGLQYIEREERLSYVAYYDLLTGLPNATLFQDRLRQLMQGTLAGEYQLALYLLDLDRFTQINDTCGRHVGDAVLIWVAETLEANLSGAYALTRVGNDTFAVALGELPAASDPAAILQERVLGPIATPLTLGEHEIRLTARAGIAVFPADGQTPETLLHNAEAALKQAETGSERFLYYSADMNAHAAARLSLENALRRAIDAGQLLLHFQPKVSLATGRIVGAEALVRWQHPERGMISPAQFIPLAEETGLIVPIGDWVMRTVCHQQAAWLAQQLDTVPVAINLSPLQFKRVRLTETLDEVLRSSAINAELLELELTETLVMENLAEAAKTMNAVRERGIRLSLDDFGTGYSSLAYLKRFPFDSVKIDRSFVTDITRNPEDAAIAAAIIAMAHTLKLQVIAEGVESEAQLQYLLEQGCDEIQGYYFSRPVPAAEFEAQLRTGHRLPLAGRRAEIKPTLLIVDDEPAVLAALQRAMRQEGYQVLTAENAPQALDLMAIHRPQVVISDQRMPHMTGAEFLSIVSELYPDTIRIILTGYTELQTIIDSVNRGTVFKFLTKPWDDALIRQHVRDAFRRYRPMAA